MQLEVWRPRVNREDAIAKGVAPHADANDVQRTEVVPAQFPKVLAGGGRRFAHLLAAVAGRE